MNDMNQCKPNNPAIVHCPVCQAAVTWEASSTWKPFCSERCSLIDLGEWFDEKPRIPVEADLMDIEDDYHS